MVTLVALKVYSKNQKAGFGPTLTKSWYPIKEVAVLLLIVEDPAAAISPPKANA